MRDDLNNLVNEVAESYVHWLYPRFRMPAYLAYPDEASAQAVLAGIERASVARGVPMEIVDLSPAPSERLNSITSRLCGFGGDTPQLEEPHGVRLLVLKGFDLLEGSGNDAATYPFRTEFQFDEAHLWLFLGADLRRLRRLFTTYRLPLNGAASDLTPEQWRL